MPRIARPHVGGVAPRPPPERRSLAGRLPAYAIKNAAIATQLICSAAGGISDASVDGVGSVGPCRFGGNSYRGLHLCRDLCIVLTGPRAELEGTPIFCWQPSCT